MNGRGMTGPRRPGTKIKGGNRRRRGNGDKDGNDNAYSLLEDPADGNVARSQAARKNFGGRLTGGLRPPGRPTGPPPEGDPRAWRRGSGKPLHGRFLALAGTAGFRARTGALLFAAG